METNNLCLNNLNIFCLEILEYCNRKLVLDQEQYYINLLKPKNNILLYCKVSYSLRFIKDGLDLH
jgi:hypothetical protein